MRGPPLAGGGLLSITKKEILDMDLSPLGNGIVPENARNLTTPRTGYIPRSQTNAEEPAKEGHKNHPTTTRSAMLAARLAYAKKGVRTSPADTERKKPHLKGWQRKATTNPQQITAESNRWTRAGILTPTGSPDRRLVVDEDVAGELERLEEKLEIALRGTTTEVSTPSGRPHLHFSLPEGVEVPGSVGKNVKDDFEGLDVRGEGNMVLLPPTASYAFANRLPTAEAPPELIKWAQSRKKAATHGAPRPKTAVEKTDAGDGSIPSGTRHDALASILGRAHDGTRSLEDLRALAHEVNAARCVPPIGSPGNDPISDVDRIAESIHPKPPCRTTKKADPQVEELLKRCSAWWYSELLPGGGRSKLRDVYRACTMGAAKRGEARTVEVDGEEVRGLAFSESTRQIGETVRTSNVSAWKNLKRLMDAGALVAVEKPAGMAWTFVLLPPDTALAHGVNTPEQPPPSLAEEEVAGGVNPLRVDELTTPFYGWRSPVGNGGGGVEVVVEAFGEQTAEELAGRLGISRVRDLQRRRLDPLTGMGVLVRHGDTWAVPDDHASAVKRRMDEPYATVTRRRRRKTTSEGRTVVWVEETVTEASENERAEARAARHAADREQFRKMCRARLHRVAVDCFGGVDPETGEILAERRDVPAPVEEAADGPVTDSEGLEAPEQLLEVPCELTLALGRYLGLNPGRAKESPSWLGIALWAEGHVEGKPGELAVARALDELGRAGRMGAAA
jgi:hypothetical protein